MKSIIFLPRSSDFELSSSPHASFPFLCKFSHSLLRNLLSFSRYSILQHSLDSELKTANLLQLLFSPDLRTHFPVNNNSSSFPDIRIQFHPNLQPPFVSKKNLRIDPHSDLKSTFLCQRLERTHVLCPGDQLPTQSAGLGPASSCSCRPCP